MDDQCPHCGGVIRDRRWFRISKASRRTMITVGVLSLVYCFLWGATQVLGTMDVKRSLVAQGSKIGAYSYSPMPLVVCVDEIYFQPTAQQMQRADMRYGWAFGNVVELGATYVSMPDDPHFSNF